MDADDWKFELHRLFEIFERESTISLRKINQCFGILGRPFGDEFRRYFLKMSTTRLDSSFNVVLLERNFGNQIQMPSTSSKGQADSNKVASSNNRSTAKPNDHSLNAPRKSSLLGWKIKNSVHVPVGIIDSDDDSVEAVKSNATQNTEEANGHPDGEHDGTNMNAENDVEVFVKCEPKVEIMDEIVDLPMVTFDPNKENESSSAGNHASVPESIDGRNQASASASGQNLAKQTDGNRFKCKRCAYTTNHKDHFQRHQLIHDKNAVTPFKCEQCDYATQHKANLNKHQQTHDMQKLMGVARDPRNGLFKCTHCDQRFTKWHSLKQHLKKSHKNNQRLFNCKRCMRRFTQKTEMDRHEVQCQNRRYECYLCKAYITRDFNRMQHHLRTHSGAKPFECSICMKCFRSKNNLKSHVNSVHNGIST